MNNYIAYSINVDDNIGELVMSGSKPRIFTRVDIAEYLGAHPSFVSRQQTEYGLVKRCLVRKYTYSGLFAETHPYGGIIPPCAVAVYDGDGQLINPTDSNVGIPISKAALEVSLHSTKLGRLLMRYPAGIRVGGKYIIRVAVGRIPLQLDDTSNIALFN